MAKTQVCTVYRVLLFYCLFHAQEAANTFGVIQVKSNVTAYEGNSAVINGTNIEVAAKDSLLCRAEVILDPICLRFGNVTSMRFYCGDLRGGKIAYDHFGSPISAEDCLKLKFFVFYKHRVLTEIIKIKIRIKKRNVNEVLSKPQIDIKELGGVASIDREILPQVALLHLKNCKILFKHNNIWPASGHLIFSQQNNRREEICSKFRVIYKHDATYIPNIDFIPFEIKIRQGDTGQYRILKYHIKVNILPAHAKEPPFLYSRFSRVVIKQYALKQMKSSNIRAVDFKTSAENLLLKVSARRRNNLGGFFATTEKPDLPLEGFTQEQINKEMIIFVSPKVIKSRSAIQQMYVQAVDMYGKTSTRKLRILFFVRKFVAYYLSVVRNSPIHVLEGHSNNISSFDLDIACKNPRCRRAKFSVWTGPDNGQLTQNSKPVTVFTKKDILSGTLMYRHDGSETLIDNVVVTVSDGYQVAYLTLSFVIEPLDDSPPFLSIHMPIITSNYRRTKIRTSVLSAADPDSDSKRIMFHIMKRPQLGKIVRIIDNTRFENAFRFNQTELERGLIYYEKYFDKPADDLFTFILSDGGSDPNLSREYTSRVKILAVDKTPPYKTSRNDCIVRINETDLAVSLNFLSYKDDTSSSSQIIFNVKPQQTKNETIIRPKDLYQLSQHERVPVNNFTQDQIFYNKIYFINRFTELGLLHQTVFLKFVVADGGSNTTPLQKCKIIVQPVDNTPPKLRHKEDLKVLEGGNICFSSKNLIISDIDTELKKLKFSIQALPTNGEFRIDNRALGIGEWVPYAKLIAGSLCYLHDDSETLSEDFVMITSDGVQSSTKEVKISILPVNDERPYFATDTVKLDVMEASSIVLNSELFEAVDKDSKPSNLIFYMMKQPDSGFVTLREEYATNFTIDDIGDGELVYFQSDIEIGPFKKNDSFTVGVCDVIPISGNCSSVLTVLVDVIPVNSIPPKLAVNKSVFVNEKGRVLFDAKNLICTDNDTVPGDITVQIINFPKFGFLENIAPSEGSEQSNTGIRISAFKCSDLIDQTIYYVQNNHAGIEPTNDTISLRAYDGRFQSSSVDLSFEIKPVSDEAPKIDHDLIRVHEGGWKLIKSKFIRITDKDIPKEILYFYLLSLPRHGQMFYRCVNLSPGLRVIRTGEMLAYERCTLVYGHDDSETKTDDFKIAATDRKATVKATINIEIVPVNDQKPTIIKNNTMIVKFGGVKKLSRGYLTARDLDTPDNAIRYTITSLPKYGILQKNNATMPNKRAIALNVNATFTQADINSKTISYANQYMPTDNHLDSFQFSLTDGLYVVNDLTFLIRIRLSCRKYLNIVTNDVKATRPKFTVSDNNLRVETRARDGGMSINAIRYQILRPPSHGNLVLSGNAMERKIFSFSQTDVNQNRLEYKPKKYPLKTNDTFKFIVTDGKCLQRGRLNIIASEAKKKIKLLNRHTDLKVVKKGLTTITPLELRASESYNPRNVIYKIVKPPKHGAIMKDGLNISKFTQADINALSLEYDLRNEKASLDGMEIQMLLRNNVSEIEETTHENFTFNMKIDIPEKRVSQIITNEKITSLRYLSPNVLGTTITQRQLLTFNCSNQVDPNLLYVVTEPPIHGELFHKETGLPVKSFTQDDVNKGKIIYKLTDKQFLSFDDKIFLDVESDGCEKLKEIEFGINWSIITISDDISVECSSGEPRVRLKLKRRGYDKQGSVVEAHMKSVGDEEKQFSPVRVWFYPGEAEKVLTLPKDYMGYELIHVQLRNEYNTLLGKARSIVIDVSKATDSCLRNPSTSLTQQPFKDLQAGKNVTKKHGDTSFHAINLVRPDKDTQRRPDKQLSEQKKVPQPKNSKICDKGWTRFKRYCYKFMKKASNWRRAVKMCRKKNASLLTPATEEEETFVNEHQDGFSVWLGIKQNKRGRWRWSIKRRTKNISKKLDVITRSSIGTKRCISMDADGKWEANHCKDKNIRFVCKKIILSWVG